jgi:DNA polymerase (family 10)
VENAEIARVLSETADLMEIDAQDSFRIRSFRNAVIAIDNLTERIEDILADPKRKLTEIPSIGKGMAAHIEELCRSGQLTAYKELSARYPLVAREMLMLQGLGPKGVATLLSHFKIQSLEELEELARQGKMRDLPRMGEKLEQKVLKSIEAYRRSAGRHLIGDVDELAEEFKTFLSQAPGVRSVTAAGSLRRGCETIGDLDLLVTGGSPQAVAERFLKFPKVVETLAKGENKVSVKLRSGIQVDLRVLEESSHGAALQYFTGSKAHNVALRDRAKRMGYKLSEYGLFRIQDDERVAGATEEDIYGALRLPYIEPELRENTGEIEAAEKGHLPALVSVKDLRGDLHMHSTATDGRCSIREMAEAARARGLEYIAITDHSQALAMANGLDEKRVIEQIAEIRKLNEQIEGIRILAGSEVDIRLDGTLDLDNEALAQLDVVVASVHSHMNLEAAQMTDRLLRAFENPHLNILAHPTGRMLLRREGFPFDLEAALRDAARRNIQLEINSFPDRLDLRDTHARLAKQHGVKLVISTDSHHTRHLQNAKYGVLMARRAWLEPADVLNTLPAEQFLSALKRRA